MSNEFILRPEELYFLGTLMNAAYIDYDYIAALQEISRNFLQAESKCMLNLTRAKLVRQRLSGETSIHPPLEQLLKNVFFGKLETALEIVTCKKEAQRITYRIHYLAGTATMVVAKDNQLHISPITDAQLQTLIRNEVGKHSTVAKRNVQADASTISRILLVKHALVDVGSRSSILFEQNDALYLASDDEHGMAIDDEQAVRILYTMLKGE